IYRDPRSREWIAEPLAERVVVGPEVPGKRSAHERNRLRVGAVLGGEPAATKHGNAEDVEIARRDRLQVVHPRKAALYVLRLSLDAERDTVDGPGNGKTIDRGH